MSHSSYAYTPKARDCSAVRMRMRAIALSRVHYGCEQMFVVRLVAKRGRPAAIRVVNGSEFAGKVMDRGTYENGVELDFSRCGTPTDNALVESFNGRLRQECQNEHWFLSLADARSKIEAWQRLYNQERPRSALAWKTPE